MLFLTNVLLNFIYKLRQIKLDFFGFILSIRFNVLNYELSRGAGSL